MRTFLFAMLVSAAAFAQPPRGFIQWWDGPIARNLNLTEAQNREIRGVVREFRVKLIEQRAALDKAETELQFAMDDDTVDVKRAQVCIENLASSRLNLTRTYAQMVLRLRTVLTPVQYHELQKRQNELPARRQLQRRQPAVQP